MDLLQSGGGLNGCPSSNLQLEPVSFLQSLFEVERDSTISSGMTLLSMNGKLL